MSMSDIAFEIECALDDGFTYDEIIQGLINQYGCTRSEAFSMINSTIRIMDREERAAEIQFEADGEF